MDKFVKFIKKNLLWIILVVAMGLLILYKPWKKESFGDTDNVLKVYDGDGNVKTSGWVKGDKVNFNDDTANLNLNRGQVVKNDHDGSGKNKGKGSMSLEYDAACTCGSFALRYNNGDSNQGWCYISDVCNQPGSTSDNKCGTWPYKTGSYDTKGAVYKPEKNSSDNSTDGGNGHAYLMCDSTGGPSEHAYNGMFAGCFTPQKDTGYLLPQAYWGAQVDTKMIGGQYIGLRRCGHQGGEMGSKVDMKGTKWYAIGTPSREKKDVINWQPGDYKNVVYTYDESGPKVTNKDYSGNNWFDYDGMSDPNNEESNKCD